VRESLLEILVDPISKGRLRVEAARAADGELWEGTLLGGGGRSYAITEGIPRFVLTEDEGQRQTEGSFGYKWTRESFHTPESYGFGQKFLVESFGFDSVERMREFFGSRRRILDAGCGSGFSTGCWLDRSWRGEGDAEWVGADISRAVDVARQNLGSFPGTNFVQADILQLPFRAQSFDTIFSEGVLHHTPSTEKALKALVPLLAPGGEILFYVYRKKGPIREFADDYIRDVVAPLPPEEAWELMRPLTHLAQALAELRAEVEVPEDIPYLGIKAGRYDVQRLIYWHFLKIFWNGAFTFEQNVTINFDWYHPRYAHRQTEAEVRRWCDESGLSVTWFHVQDSGFSVRAFRE
jgi:arsenite methyltransferase